MYNELAERHCHLPLAYLFPIMHLGFVQILSNFTCVTESVFAHSYLAENLEEHDCHKWRGSRRGHELWIWFPNRISRHDPLQQEPPGMSQLLPRHGGISSSLPKHNSQSLVRYQKQKRTVMVQQHSDGWVTVATRGAADGGEEVPGEKNWVDTLEGVPGNTQREQLQLSLGVSKRFPGYTRKNKRDSEREKANGHGPGDPAAVRACYGRNPYADHMHNFSARPPFLLQGVEIL